MNSYIQVYTGEYTGNYNGSTGVTEATLAFLALVADTDGDYGMQLQDTGSGTPSVARTGSSYALDSDGVYRSIPANTALWQDSRILKNYQLYSNDQTNAANYRQIGDAGTSDPNVVTKNQIGLDGQANTACLITDDSNTTLEGIDSFDNSYTSANDSLPITSRIFIKKTPSPESVFGVVVLSSQAGNPRLQSYYKIDRYNGLAIGLSGLDDGTVTVQEYPLNTDWWEVIHTVVNNSSSNFNWFTGYYPCRSSSWDGDITPELNLTQTGIVGNMEMYGSGVTTAEVLGTPWIYTTTASVNGGFSGSDGAASPTPLSPQPSMHVDPELTNEWLYSNNVTATGWVTNGLISTSFDQIGLTGEANTASLANDTDTGTTSNVTRGVAGYFTGTETRTHTSRYWIKYEDNETVNPLLYTAYYTGGTTQNAQVHLNRKTGAYYAWDEAGFRYSVQRIGDWWEICLELTENATGNTKAQTQIYPSFGATLGVSDVTATGSVIIGNTEFYNDTTLEQVKGTPPIFTTSAAVSNNPQTSTWDAANHDPTVDQAYYFEYEGNVGDGTELLIHSNTTDGSTTFTDSSNNNFTVTPTGNAQHSTTVTPALGTSSMKFDGTGDYLTVADNDLFDWDKDHLFEMFVRFTDVSQTEVLFDHRNTGGAAEGVRVYTVAGVFYWQYDWGVTAEAMTDNSPSNGVWYHYAGIKRGDEYIFYRDGVEIDRMTHALTMPNIAQDLHIGCDNGTGNQFTGYLDEIRMVFGRTFNTVSKPTEMYPDPEPLVKNPILATQDTDTVLLIHSDTFDGDDTFTDSSYLGNTITEFGSCVHNDTNGSVFGRSAIYIPPTSTLDHYLGFDASQVLNFGTGEFTVEFWAKFTTLGSHQRPAGSVTPTGSGGSFEMYVSPADILTFNVRWGNAVSEGNSINTDSALDTSWHHYAFVRDGNTLRLYVDGVAQTGTVDWTGRTFNNTANQWRLGHAGTYQSSNFDGSYAIWDEFRITKGVCRYPGGTTFTVPTEPFDRGTLAQVEIAYVDPQGNLVIEDANGAKATKALSAGVNKCGIFKESGNVGVTVGGSTGTLVASTGDIGGNGDIQVLHGVQSPAEIKDLRRYTGGSLQTTLETETT